ncbi:MAG: hypothetical protein PHO20_03085 [Candidatus Peribacteraceae bacterium]|nr:hypothetical protein [Candidatus Peribacteraceae bacterium]
MGTRDDEDVWVSTSRQEKFTRADPRKDALKREVESRQGKSILDKDAQKLKELKTKVNLSELQSQMAGRQQEEQTKRNREEDEDKKHQTFHTETIKEKEEEDIDTAKTKATPERLIKKEEDKREEQAQAGQEYQQQVG